MKTNTAESTQGLQRTSPAPDFLHLVGLGGLLRKIVPEACSQTRENYFAHVNNS